ncbi:MAG: D-alanyl-D-alanine carboxypeptidase [Tunicatimonas sp.]
MPAIVSRLPHILCVLAGLSIVSCTGMRSRDFRRAVDHSPVFSQSFTGFAIYDVERREMVHEYQADKYYTPASNTKIFTLYASLMLLGDSIPALQYRQQGDTLFFTGTGDPTFLHPDISRIDTTYEQGVYLFLRTHPGPLVYVERPTRDAYFGPGWAWDDYEYYYSTEKSVMPIYGNVVRFQFKKNLPKPLVYPASFTASVQGFADPSLAPNYLRRAQYENLFSYGPKADTLVFTRDVPFIQSTPTLLTLLRDTLQRPVAKHHEPYRGEYQTYYSVPSDSVYRRMMQQSDNFLAEQLLLLASSTQQDTLSTRWVIDEVTERFLSDLPDAPQWVDGSGLSRYNMQTPRSMVAILLKVDSLLGDRRIKMIFPAGGVSGTVENWYAGPDAQPYVFAKTGTLGGKHCLSGFLYTRSGKKLVFSFMHNNYVTSSSVFKAAMERILEEIHRKY